MRRVLIPIDGSEPALRAVKYAASFASYLREPLEVLLLNVQHPPAMRDLVVGGQPSEIQSLEAPLRKAGEQLLAPARAMLKKSNIAHASYVEFGELAPTIVQFSNQQHCEEIIMSTRGLGAVAGLVLGSVAYKVMHLARVPLMLVK